MSHIVTIKTRVQDTAAVGAACQRLSLPVPTVGTAILYGGSVMAAPSTNGSHAVAVNSASNGVSNSHTATVRRTATQPQSKSGLADLIVEAESLKDSVRELYTRANGLVGAIKRHRKQSKLVATTLASLRQLQKIDA